jgi:nitrite reductase (NO-forming)
MNGNRALPSMEVAVQDASRSETRRADSIPSRSRLAHARFSTAWGGAAVRVAFGMVWLADAVLKWLPAYRTNFLDQLRAGVQGQPRWLHPWFHLVVRLVSPRIALFAYGTAIVETLLALALLAGFARKFTYVGGAAYSLLVWATAEGFGGPYSGSSTDIGAAIIYAVVFLALLVVNARSETSRYSVDRLIEGRWAWWHRVAEVGRPPAGGGDQ